MIARRLGGHEVFSWESAAVKLLARRIGYNLSVATGTHNTDAVIRIRCKAGHTVTTAPSGVRVTHSSGIVVGHAVWCAECGADDSVVAAPERIAMLLEMGVELAPLPLPLSADVALPMVSDHRRLVSAKYLATDEALAQLSNASHRQDVL